MLTSDYNIASTRRRLLKPMIGEPELHELVEMEKVCFPPPEKYNLRTLRGFVSLNGAGLLRWYEEVEGKQRLAAFHLFDCFASELITLDVHPDFRRKGIGKKLVESSMAKLRELGHRYVSCQISTTNEASIVLHKLLGFRPVQVLKNYYGPGRHAYLMTAKLR